MSTLEKALSKNDFAAQKAPLEAIVRALRPLRLKSLEDLDLGTRGKLITSLLRTQRQPKPPAPEAPAAEGAASEAAASEAPASGAPAAEAAPTEGAAAEATSGDAAAASEAPTEPAGSETPPAAPAAPAADPVREKYTAYTDVMFLVGQAWRAAGERERAEPAFAAAGRQPRPEDDAPPAAAASGGAERSARGERPERGPRGERPERGARGERPERAPRGDRPERPERAARGERPERERRPPLEEFTGPWEEQVKQLEAAGRTRDAARIHERNNSFAEAVRLFEAGGDLKSALRAALAGKDTEASRRLVGTLPADQVPATLEKAGAYELLMEHYVGKGDFENVAKLYERARQHDQAALAYERAGKYGLARKAFERAKDMAGAGRVRGLEVKGLVERGDRLGAATLLAGAGQRREAVELLSALPPPKAFHFLQRLKLDEEAQTLARSELAKAEAENKPAGRARWLELLGDRAAAADIWEQSGRKDKALALHEAMGNTARAAALAESLSLRDKAIALYTQLNDAAGLERASALPTAPAQPAEQAPSAPTVDEQESQ
nr:MULTISPECIES: DEAD/DEAH box helicase [Myxococcaceae]